jgi:hypothetical protein
MSSSLLPIPPREPPATPFRAPSTIHEGMAQTQHSTHMASGIKDAFLGPMPAGEFLSKFFPSRSVLSKFEEGHFKDVLTAKPETAKYDPFVSLDCCISLVRT